VTALDSLRIAFNDTFRLPPAATDWLLCCLSAMHTIVALKTALTGPIEIET
jgi:hypothetical protein